MAFKTEKGFILRNPSEKGKRFGRQLKNNCVTETGEVLTPEQRSFRKGYLSARSDSAKVWCAQTGTPSKAKKRHYDKKTGKVTYS